MLKKYAKAEERVGKTEKEIQEAERRKREVGAVLEGVGGDGVDCEQLQP